MRQLLMMVLIGGLLVLVGCGDKPELEVQADAESRSADAPSDPQVVSPLEMLPKQETAEPQNAGNDEQVQRKRPDAPVAEIDEELAAEIDALVNADAVNAIHKIAGRSAFPNQGEVITEPIPAKKLSDNNPFSEAIDEANIPDVVPWNEAAKYVGYEITVEGKIVDIGQSRDGKTNFLNFHKDWRGKFYMVVFDDLVKTLPKSVDATFRGKTLRVKGIVDEHRGRPQIKILSMDQVEVVGG